MENRNFSGVDQKIDLPFEQVLYAGKNAWQSISVSIMDYYKNYSVESALLFILLHGLQYIARICIPITLKGLGY